MLERIATAVVMADGLETRYLRCGAGQTVVLVGGDRRLAITLATTCRVIAPQVPPRLPMNDLVTWLRGVFDGLGIAEASIVATPEFAELAHAFAAAESERVTGVEVSIE